jgi:hypothetical protein
MNSAASAIGMSQPSSVWIASTTPFWARISSSRSPTELNQLGQLDHVLLPMITTSDW